MAHPARAKRDGTIDDVPTLRLVTLRRLLAGLGPPLVFEVTADIASVAAGLRASRTSAAALVDEQGILQGTLSLAELAGADGRSRAETAMTIGAPMLAPESNIEDALRAMRTHHASCVVVAAASGELLGVLTAGDLACAPGAA